MTERSLPLPSRARTGTRRWLRAAATLVAPAAVILSTAGTAAAQGWLADRSVAEGAGIRTGDLELHPGVGGEVGYDSNWFLRSSKEGATIANGAPNLPVRDALVFRITPSFYVSTLGQQRMAANGVPTASSRLISFRGGVSATGRIFVGKEMEKQHNVSVNADARMDVGAGRPISFGVFGAYNRLIQPQVQADPNLSFNRDDLRAGAEVVALPGGGTFDIRAGYQVAAALFEETQGQAYNSLTHEVTVKNRWRFRPRTAVFSETSLRWVNYLNAENAFNYLNDSTPIRTRVGLTGLVTERISTLLAAGYGVTFFKEPNRVSSAQYDSVNAQAEVSFYLGKGGATEDPNKASLVLSSFKLGFTRDFQNSLLGNFYTSNKLYGGLQYWFGGSFVTQFNIYGEQLKYPPVFLTGATGQAPVQVTGDFTNYRLGAQLFAEYRLSQAFGLNCSLDYIQQFSDTQIRQALPGATTAGSDLVFDLNYRRFQGFAGARYFF